jgi:predicted RNA-binding protein with PUA-like domain
MPNVWLMKSEPDAFSLEDLKNAPRKTEPWDGIRNYQARNLMRDDMVKGDTVLFYHSNCKEPAIVGLAEIASKAAYPDPTQFDKKAKYFDPKSDPENPRWLLVDVRYRKKLKQPVTLKAIKEHPVLKDMKVAQRGMRLSIQPVEKKHYKLILKLAGE